MLNGRYSMNKKFLTMGCISSLSLAMYAGCSDSTSAVNPYSANDTATEINGDSSSSALDDIEIITSSESHDSNSATSSATNSGNVTVSSSSEIVPTSSAINASSASNGTSSAVTASSSSIVPAINSSSSTTQTVQSSSSAPAAQSSSSAPVTQSSSSTQPEQVSGNTGERPVITYAASGATATNAGNCVSVTGGTVTIKCGGEYDFSGSYSGSDAQILVATAKTDTTVYLNMKGLTLTNSVDAPIYIQKANKAFVVVKNGTTNTFTEAATRTKTYSYTNDAGQAKVDTTGACIYAKDDLTIKGEGTLIVNPHTSGNSRAFGHKSSIQTYRKLRLPVLAPFLGESILPSLCPAPGIIGHRLRRSREPNQQGQLNHQKAFHIGTIHTSWNLASTLLANRINQRIVGKYDGYHNP